MLEHRTDQGILICQLTGRLDANAVEALAAELLPLIEGPERRVLINLAQLTYISSAGLRALVQAAKVVKGSGGALKLCSATPNVRKVLEISGMDQLFDLRDDENLAVAAFAG